MKKILSLMFLASLSLPSMARIITVPVDMVAIDDANGVVLHTPTKEQLDYSLAKQRLNNDHQIQVIQLTHAEQESERQFDKDNKSLIQKIFGGVTHKSCPLRHRR